MGNVMMSKIVPQTLSPAPGLLLSRMAPGSVVKLNENGSPAEFYVLQHDYESTRNGAGRTLLVRKEGYDKRNWADFNTYDYREASITTWLTETYAKLFDADVQTAMGKTKFLIGYNASSSVYERSDAVFLLSCTEIGYQTNCRAIEGTAIPAASVLFPMPYNGDTDAFWLRSSYGNTSNKYVYAASGNTPNCGTRRPNTTDTSLYACTRPCFTLPVSAFFDEETLLFKGVL